MKIAFEYPWQVWCNRDEDIWKDITMFDMTFSTSIHYFNNHDNGFRQLIVKILGFGIRISNKVI